MKAKVVVMNFSGNVGKSTISRHLLSPRMGNARIIPIETINSNEHEEEAMKGKQFGELIDEMALTKNVVVDVGASNVLEFISRMVKYKNSHADFDYFVIPVVPKIKQQIDTTTTIKTLSELGIPAKKIRLVFNMMEEDEELETIFKGIFEYYGAHKIFTLAPEAVIYTNDLYAILKGLNKTVTEIATDNTNFEEKIENTEDREEQRKWARLRTTKKLAMGVMEEHDTVFQALFQ